MSAKKRGEKPASVEPGKDEFEKSLDSFGNSKKSGGTAKKKNRSSRRVTNIIFISVLVLCIAVLAVCVVLIVKNIMDKERGNEIYDDASDIFNSSSMFITSDKHGDGDDAPKQIYDSIESEFREEESSEQENREIDLDYVRAKISELKQINEDVVGWIFVEDTQIDYPLMRSSTGDDDYYLNHAYTGEYLSVGSIYMVSDCDVKLENNYNTLIYGHNLTNGKMFHDVGKFFDAEFFSRRIFICTLDGVYIYQPFSVYRTQSDYNYIQTYFASDAEFLNFATEMKGNSEVSSDVTVGDGDRILTLSTCTASGVVSAARYSLHAKLIEIVR